MNIKIITTGGTIDKVYFDARSDYQVGSPQVLEILKDHNVAFEYEVVSILQKDSLDMTEADRQAIRQAVAAARSRYTDAIFNVGCAIAAAQTLSPGVYIAMSGRVYAANRVAKNYATRRFEEMEE